MMFIDQIFSTSWRSVRATDAAYTRDDLVRFASVRRLHAELLLDLTPSPLLRETGEGLQSACAELARLTPLEYLTVFQSMSDAAVESFHGTLEIDLGRGVDLPARLKGWLRKVERLWVDYYEGPLTFALWWYSYAVFPLRLDLSVATANYDRLVQVNESRDAYLPSAKLVDMARAVIDDSFAEDVISHFQPHHGPGSVGYRSAHSYRTSRLTLRGKDRILDPSFIVTKLCSLGIPYPWLLNTLVFPTTTVQYDPLPSQVKAVPKSWKKKRLIAVEDANLMYLQEGVREGLYKAIKNSPVLSRIIHLEESEINRQAAHFASMTRSYATIDLSDASDSVGFRFCERLLSHSPVWKILTACRSRYLEVPEHGVIKSKMMATMGNAFCFPIESIVFALIACEALDDVGSQSLPLVYGDDIVIHNDAVSRMLELLANYGFNVNHAKTYYGSMPYRESCGGEFVGRDELRLLRIPRTYLQLDTSGRAISNQLQLLDLHNRAITLGYFRTARLVYNLYLSDKRYCVSERNEIGLINGGQTISSTPENWNASLFQATIPCQRVTPRTKKSHRSVWALIEWLWKRFCNPEVVPLEPRFGMGRSDVETYGGVVTVISPLTTSHDSEIVGFSLQDGDYVPTLGYFIPKGFCNLYGYRRPGGKGSNG